MSVSSHFRFSFFVGFGQQSYEKSLACLALQTETIVKKITQPKLPKTKIELTKISYEPCKTSIIL